MDVRDLGKLMRGLGLVMEALAGAVDPRSEVAPTDADEFLFGPGDANSALQTSAPAGFDLAGLLRGLVGRVGGAGPTEAQDDAEDAPRPAPVAPRDDSVIPAIENGVPLMPCPEMDRQKREARRRRVLREDPVQAMTTAAYWLLHLAEVPMRAEDWTRSIECLPGSASDRFSAALQLGMSELGLYAARYDECMDALQAGKDKAEQLASAFPNAHRDAGRFLDADRIGRILFWLGDRPDVEAILDAPPASGDVRALGSDHIEGAPGSVQSSADQRLSDYVAEELLTIEELEKLHPLPQDD